VARLVLAVSCRASGRSAGSTSPPALVDRAATAGRRVPDNAAMPSSPAPAPGPADPLASWRAQLEAWTIPEEILARAPESPWGYPVGLFRARAEQAGTREPSPSDREAARWLPPGGTVLDVGAGAGSASLALARTAGRIVAVDESAAMLDAFVDAAAAARVPAATVQGRWPDVAVRVGPADVVVCHHVLYNVADLAPFVAALTGHARRRVVVELTGRHPLVDMGPLWRRFHGLDRPKGPTADDAEAALRALGLEVEREDRTGAPRVGFERWEDLVAFTRRRLCLPAERDPEVAAALAPRRADTELGVRADRGPQTLVTLSWSGSAPPPR
jgi:SAM-dependent methyltransferase